jgi:hypothetical protein
MYKVIAVILIFSVLYIVVKMAVPRYRASNLESTLEKILDNYDGRSVLHKDESSLKAQMAQFVSVNSIPIKSEEVEVTWDRFDEELMIAVDINYPQPMSLFGFGWESKLNLHQEKLIIVDIEEEERIREAREEEERRRIDEEERYQSDMEEKCERMAGEWNGRECVLTKYIFIPG